MPQNLGFGLLSLKQSRLFVVLTYPAQGSPLVRGWHLYLVSFCWVYITAYELQCLHLISFFTKHSSLLSRSIPARTSPKGPSPLRGLPSALPDAPATSPSSDAHAASAFSPSLSRPGWQVTLNLASRAVDGKCLGIVKIVASLSPRRNRRRRLAVLWGASAQGPRAWTPIVRDRLRRESRRKRWETIRRTETDREKVSFRVTWFPFKLGSWF